MTIPVNGNFPHADLALARRIELMEGITNSGFVEARAELFPQTGAIWIRVGGGYALFDGPHSPVTQTFGLGLFEEITDGHLDEIEAFYFDRNTDVNLEVCPLPNHCLHLKLSERGYDPIEFTSILYRPVSGVSVGSLSLNPMLRVRRLKPEEAMTWAEIAADGWREFGEMDDLLHEVARISMLRVDTHLFVAELGERPIAAGVLAVCDGILHLAGACTIPEARRQGAQLALLESRLDFGSRNGCDIAVMGTQPGSASQRNAERHGFRVAYTRIKWQLKKS